MAFIVPMHCNKPNIIYLFTSLIILICWISTCTAGQGPYYLDISVSIFFSNFTCPRQAEGTDIIPVLMFLQYLRGMCDICKFGKANKFAWQISDMWQVFFWQTLDELLRRKCEFLFEISDLLMCFEGLSGKVRGHSPINLTDGLLAWLFWVQLISPEQNVCHFADGIFRSVFVNEKFSILIKISLKFVPKVPIDNDSALI